MNVPRDTDWLGDLEAWLGLMLVTYLWYEFLFPSMIRWSETPPVDFLRPAYLEHFQNLAILDGIAIGLAVAGIRFGAGISRWAAVFAGLLGSTMFLLFCGSWGFVVFYWK
jgi:hypothetical protein